MQTRRSTILGKRGHQESSTPAPSPEACEQLQTPDNTPTPKRARTTVSLLGDDSNKENVPPFNCTPINVGNTPRATRALRRAATEATLTPPRTRPGPRRTASVVSLASTSTTPSPENLHVAISTPPPTPPANLLPLHARVRALLRSTCNNSQTQIAGRETERATIVDFLSSFTEGSPKNDSSDSSSTLFISGAPGTGKTALVNSIIRELSTENDTGLNVISINCMSLKGVDALWERMIEDLSSSSKSKSKKLKGRDGLTSILDSLKSKCIVVLDELDHITPNAQSLTSIFTLTEKLSPQLRLIAIANTHTLTSSSSTNALIPSTHVHTIHFAPYSPTQLQSILQSRLTALSDDDCSAESSAAVKKLLPTPALTLLTKKVAALTGDVRSLFEVLRGAIDLAVAAAVSKSAESEENPLNPPSLSVSPQNILAALKAYTPASVAPKTSGPSSGGPATASNSETVTKIRNLGLQARLVLLAMILASKRLESGLSLLQTSANSPRKPSASPMKRSSSLPNPTATSSPGVETSSLHAYYTMVLSRTESGIFEPVSRSEFGDLLGVLEGVGIASLSSSLSVAAGMSSPTKGRKVFSRSSSFGAGLGRNGAGAVGEVRLTEGMWGDEVLRGLGVSGAIDAQASDAREEEVRVIWEREQTRLARDVKASISASNSQLDTFAGAFQD